ncbi:HAD-superfamily hydrolase [Gracilaria domingensis]|nr:HAD-superfamily hydrolase [Gracilaria domingensis]
MLRRRKERGVNGSHVRLEQGDGGEGGGADGAARGEVGVGGNEQRLDGGGILEGGAVARREGGETGLKLVERGVDGDGDGERLRVGGQVRGRRLRRVGHDGQQAAGGREGGGREGGGAAEALKGERPKRNAQGEQQREGAELRSRSRCASGKSREARARGANCALRARARNWRLLAEHVAPKHVHHLDERRLRAHHVGAGARQRRAVQAGADGDAAHAGALGRLHAGHGVLHHHAARRLHAQLARRLEEHVRRRLLALDLVAAGHVVEVRRRQPDGAEVGVHLDAVRRRRHGHLEPQLLHARDEPRHARERRHFVHVAVVDVHVEKLLLGLLAVKVLHAVHAGHAAEEVGLARAGERREVVRLHPRAVEAAEHAHSRMPAGHFRVAQHAVHIEQHRVVVAPMRWHAGAAARASSSKVRALHVSEVVVQHNCAQLGYASHAAKALCRHVLEPRVRVV